jgi:hypothetical protein
MENLLPFLAGLAYMAYKIYSNYQKEQEAAKKRNPSQSYQPESAESYPEWVEEEVYQPENTYEFPSEKYHEPKYEPAYRETPVAEVKVKPTAVEKKVEIPFRVELHNPEIPSEEVVKNRLIHEPHKHKFVASQEEEQFYSDFDFKDAIVKEAILNRPQY